MSRSATRCVLAASAVALSSGAAHANVMFSTVNPARSSELGHRRILENMYGGSWSTSGSVDFTNGSILAFRITDAVSGPVRGVPFEGALAPTDFRDITWSSSAGGNVPVTVHAKYAGDNSVFGWFDDTQSTPTFQPILNTASLGTSASVAFSSNFRFALRDLTTGSIFTTRPSDNPGVGSNANRNARFDQFVTYYVTGLPGGRSEWALFVEDRVQGQSSDYDFNDAVVTVAAVPAPGAAGVFAAAGVLALRRRRR